MTVVTSNCDVSHVWAVWAIIGEKNFLRYTT